MESARTVLAVAFRALQGVAASCEFSDHAQVPANDAEPLPIERWLALLEHLATVHFDGLPRLKALEEIGAGAFAQQMNGAAGALLRGFINQGPERFLIRGAGLSRHYVNFGEWAVTPLGAGHVRCQVLETPIPGHYYIGYFRAALRACGVEADVRVEIGEECFTLEFRYRELALIGEANTSTLPSGSATHSSRMPRI